jgi:predicted nucleotidyltransferase
LDATYGGHIERVMLFGSRSRGDADADSDYDVAVFLHGLSDRWRETDRFAPIPRVLGHLAVSRMQTLAYMRRKSLRCLVRMGSGRPLTRLSQLDGQNRASL